MSRSASRTTWRPGSSRGSPASSRCSGAGRKAYVPADPPAAIAPTWLRCASCAGCWRTPRSPRTYRWRGVQRGHRALCAHAQRASPSNGGASSSPATTRRGPLSVWALARRRRRGPMPSRGPHESPGATPTRQPRAVAAPGSILREGALSGYPPTAVSPSAHECPGNRVGYKGSFPRTTVLGYGRPSRWTRTPSSR